MKHLKLFFALFAMLALGVGNAWAEDVTVTKTTNTLVSELGWSVSSGNNCAGCYTEFNLDDVITISTTGTPNSGSIWGTTTNDWRLYQNQNGNVIVTAKTGYELVSVKFTYSQSNSGTLKDGSTTVATKNVVNCSGLTTKTLTVGNTGTKTNGQVRITEFSVTYVQTSSSGETPEPSCTPINPILTYSSTSLLTNSTATATLEGNTGKGDVTYTTSDDKVATVAVDGTVTAVGAGTATITATIAAAGEYCGGTATAKITVTPLISCSEVYNLADDETFVLKEFEVTYVNGKYSYIKDDTGYGLIFNNAGAYGLKAGDQVAAAELAGKKDTYNGLVEIIPTSVFADLEIASGTAPDPEVMNALPVKADMNKYVKFEDVTFASTTFSSKKVTGKINAGNITFYDQFATNATFNTSKKYDVIGAVSIYNSTIQVNFISAEEVAESTLNVKITNADFGKIAINGKAERTLTLNGSRLTNTVSLAIEGEGAEHFTLDSESVTPTDGNITDAKIKITYEPIAEGTHTATLKITSDDVDEQTITLTGQAVQQHTVHFFVNGEEQTDLAKKVLSGNTLEELPTATSCDLLNYPTFAGWTSAEIDGTTDVKPTMLDLSTPFTSDCNYYAVFEKATVGGSSEEQTETINAASFAGITGTTERVLSANSSTWTWNKGSGTNIANYEEIRLYANHTMTISPKDGCDISKIVVDINTGKPASAFADGGLSGASMTRVENTATLTPTSGDIVITQSNQSRVNSFVVTYTTSTTTYTYLTTCESVTPTYAVTYNLDGGSSTCETSVVVEQDSELTLCDAPTKTGHTFLKWKDQSDNEYDAGTTITVSSNLTLTAQWQKESYKVTWMSLGTEVASADVEYNAQPTKPAEDPTYTCLSGTKEFVGWTTQEIDGVGVPANLYTEEFLVVTEPITYYAVFAGKSAEASITTNTLLVTEKLGNYTSGNMKDDQQSVWNYFAGGLEDGETLYLALRNKESETSYIESPKFTGTVQSIVAHVKNGSGSKVRTVYLRSSATAQPTEGDLGETSIPTSNNSEVTLNITPSFDKFFIQVSDGLQFHKIVVTSGIAAGAYIDYITSCEAVTSSITIEDVAMNVGDTHTINATITPAAAESAVTYTIKENTENAISLSGNTITALAEGTATITATIEDAANYTGTTVDFTVTVNPAPVTDKVVILAQYDGKWYAMKAEYLSDNTDRLVGVLVNYIDGKLYEVDDAIKPLIEWDRTTSVDNVTFQNNSKYLKGKTTTVLNLEAEATGLYQWNSDYTMVLSGSSTVRTFMYNGEAFRNFAVSNAGKVVNEVLYSELPVVTAPVYATGLIIGEGENTLPDGETKDVVISRSFTADALYTLSLPFALDASQVEAIFGTGTTLYQFSGLEQAGKELVMQFSNVTAIAAATPYLIKPAQNVDPGTLVEGVTIKIDPVNIEFTAGATTVTMKPILSATEEQTNGTTQYWLATNNYLYNNKTQLLSLRALFEMTTVSGMPPRCRAEFSENEETALDYISTTDAPIKVIENGQLIIIRDGEMYNAMGVKL